MGLDERTGDNELFDGRREVARLKLICHYPEFRGITSLSPTPTQAPYDIICLFQPGASFCSNIAGDSIFSHSRLWAR